MPIYEYYCPNNHTIYQFYAKTLAQGRLTPRCPDNPAFKMVKTVSNFAVHSGGKKIEDGSDPLPGSGAPDANATDDPKMEAAMGAMEREFSSVDENDPRAMGRMMRRMAELTGEKIDGEMEEVVRKLEEGADPDALEEQMGGAFPEDGADQSDAGGPGEPEPAEKKQRFKVRRPQPRRDPQLYDYE
jgi:hypothetical protein